MISWLVNGAIFILRHRHFVALVLLLYHVLHRKRKRFEARDVERKYQYRRVISTM